MANNPKNMADDFLDEESIELIDLFDEEGNSQTFEILDTIKLDGFRYVALYPFSEEEEEIEEDGEFVVLKAVGDSNELTTIDDDDEYEKIGAMFLARFNEEA